MSGYLEGGLALQLRRSWTWDAGRQGHREKTAASAGEGMSYVVSLLSSRRDLSHCVLA